MTITTKYRIAWRSTVTAASGTGQPVFATKGAADQWAKQLDQRFAPISLTHWAEAVDVDDQPAPLPADTTGQIWS